MAEELRLIPRQARVPSPTLREVVAVFFRQGRLVVVSFGLVFASVFIYGLVAPSYEARMKVLVRRGRVDPLATPAPTPPPEFVREETSEEELNSEAELLRDGEILRQVAQASGLSVRRSWLDGLHGGDAVKQARSARRLAGDLAVEPVRKTSLITVSYSSRDPELAAKVLRELAAAYLAKHQRVRRPSGEFNFFEQQMTQARTAMEQAQMRLTEFTRAEGVVSAALERDALLQKLSDAEAGHRQDQVTVAETAQRVRTLESRLHSLPERTTTEIRSADNPELLEKMKSKLLELGLRRTQLLTEFEPSYRLVQEVDDEIAQTRASIAQEQLAPLRAQTTNQDANHEWAKSELLKSQVELSALSARSIATGRMLTDYRETAQRLGKNAVKQEEMLRGLKSAEEKYLLYVNKREEARIGDALDQGGILNVTIAEQPSVPVLPLHSAWSFGLVGLALATTVSSGLAFTVDYLDPAFRTPDEVVIYLGSPVLASLPRHDG